MENLRKIVSGIVLLALLAALLPASAFAATNAGVTFEMANVDENVYKLVFKAKSPDTIMLFSCIFSFDKTVIQPVMSQTTGADYDFDEYLNHQGLAFEMLLRGPDAIPGVIPGKPYSFIFPKSPASSWREVNDRVGVYVNIMPDISALGATAVSYGEYRDLFAFYFRLQDGKALEDVVADTFKFETADDPDSIIECFFSCRANCFGIYISQGEGRSAYSWGHDSSLWNGNTLPLNENEVINPFAGLKPDPDETDKDDPIDEEPPEDGDPDDEQPPVDGEIPDPEEAGTLPADEAELIEAILSAYVEKLSGNNNRLFITVTEVYSDGTVDTIEWDGLIDNNATATYQVDEYQVYVETKGNDQIRDCYIVE